MIISEHTYMQRFNFFICTLILMTLMGCNTKQMDLEVDVYETSASGNKLKKITEFSSGPDLSVIRLRPDETFQTITGFGGSFTEASAHLLNKLGKENREKVLEAYFGEGGARYSLTRTHMNSCDFSLSNYSYAPVA